MGFWKRTQISTQVPLGNVLKALFLCKLWGFHHNSSEKGGQEGVEQQTFRGEERVKTDSSCRVWVWVCLSKGEREEGLCRQNIFFNCFAEWSLGKRMHKCITVAWLFICHIHDTISESLKSFKFKDEIGLLHPVTSFDSCPSISSHDGEITTFTFFD